MSGTKKGSLIDFLVLKSCPRRIRTTTNRTKTCCATITPLDKHALVSGCKGKKYLAYRQIFPHLLLFYYQKIVVLLTFLSQQILSVDEVIRRNEAVLVGELLLVQRDATTLHHLAHLTL